MNRAIGKRVKRLRLNRNLTQDVLAEQLHVTRQAVSNWEMGKTAINVEYLVRLSEIFGVTMDELIYGQASPAVYKQYQKKYIGSALVCGGLMLVCLILCIVLKTALANIMGSYFVIWPAALYSGIQMLMFIAVGGLIPSLAALKFDIRLYGWIRGLALGLGFLCLCVLPVTFVGAVAASLLQTLRVVLSFLFGLGIFLGLNG